MATSKPSLFRLPGVYTAWGLQNGTLDPVELVDRCADSGIKWIAAQPPFNMDVIDKLRQECHNKGVYFGIWEVLDGLPVPPTYPNHLDDMNPNFWIANVESTNGKVFAPMLKNIRAKHPLLPLGLVTTFGGFDYDRDASGKVIFKLGRPVCSAAEPWIQYNVKVMPEAYQNTQSNLTIANMDFEARNRGWRLSFPVLGVWGGYAAANYPNPNTQDDNGYSIYLAENLTDADWATIKAWNGK